MTITGTPISSADIDAYVTLSEAGAYFTSDPRATAFLALGTGMSWYLQRATKIIDNLKLKGRTYYDFVTVSPITGQQQDKQFPRYIDGMCYGWNVNTLLPEIPQEVKDACCEEALAIYDVNASPDKKMRLSLQRQGVTSVNYQGTSEQFAQNPSGSISGAGNRYKGLMSKEAYDLLSGYLAGAIELSFS